MRRSGGQFRRSIAPLSFSALLPPWPQDAHTCSATSPQLIMREPSNNQPRTTTFCSNQLFTFISLRKYSLADQQYLMPENSRLLRGIVIIFFCLTKMSNYEIHLKYFHFCTKVRVLKARNQKTASFLCVCNFVFN